MYRAIPVLLAVFLAACSARVEYERPRTASARDAVNINAATVEELEQLPHIGRQMAEQIVAFRESNGPFRRVEHLMLIRGMSERRFVELRPLLRAD